jgi:heme/copper-type cytochrome/quinol oxidase subunit 2
VWTGVVNITLIDTSIPELKSKLGPGEAGTGTQQTPEQPSTPAPFIYWIIFFIVIPVVSGVTAYMSAKRRRRRQAPATQAVKPLAT